MTSIRITLASLLAAVAVLAGGALIHHDAASNASHKISVAGIIDCCDVATAK